MACRAALRPALRINISATEAVSSARAREASDRCARRRARAADDRTAATSTGAARPTSLLPWPRTDRQATLPDRRDRREARLCRGGQARCRTRKGHGGNSRATRARAHPAATAGRRTRRSVRCRRAHSPSAKPSSRAETIAFVCEQPALDRQRIAAIRIHEAAKGSAARHDAMTRDDERDAIGPARLTDGPGGTPHRARNFAVRARLGERNRADRFPDASLECRPARKQRHREAEGGVVEVALDFV